MTKVFIISTIGQCYDCDQVSQYIETKDWVDLDANELKNLEKSVSTLNKKYGKHYQILYKENVEDVHKDAKAFLKKLQIEEEKKAKKAEEAKAKKAENALKRKQKQLEKLQKELGAM